MKVILLRDVAHLGRKGDIKDVSEGYARNFLLPGKLALPATDAAIRDKEVREARKEKDTADERRRYADVAKKMETLALSMRMKTGGKGKTFGSVSAEKIAEVLREKGIAVDKAWVALKNPIKTTGEHMVAVAFPHGIEGKIKVIVESE